VRRPAITSSAIKACIHLLGYPAFKVEPLLRCNQRLFQRSLYHYSIGAW